MHSLEGSAETLAFLQELFPNRKTALQQMTSVRAAGTANARCSGGTRLPHGPRTAARS